MSLKLPEKIEEFMNWSWENIEPIETELINRPIDIKNVGAWLADWSRLAEHFLESFNRLYVATTIDTTDTKAEERLNHYLDNIYPKAEAANQKLKEKLLASGLTPDGFSQPLKNMRADAEIFRAENLPLKSEEFKLSNEYDKIAGSQTITWNGNEITLDQLKPVYQEINRETRETAWKTAAKRQLEDRDKFNQLWEKFLELRMQMAKNADYDNYRSYRWLELHRFDYTPENAKQFNGAIEEVVVPIAEELYNKRKERLQVDTLRPWDLNVDPFGRTPLKPFSQINDFEDKTSAIFHRVDPQLGSYFEIMRAEKLLDLDNRKGKAPGGYCTDFPVAKRPFIFMNAVGIHDDVQTLLHEGGHAFHVFESVHLPYVQQLEIGMEIAEVASMSMEFLSGPYLAENQGGFYTDREAARARIEHLETSLLFWPYMAVVDLFQHWVYENPNQAVDPGQCDRKWSELWDRYMVGVDWSGLENEKATGWQRKLHIFQVPFYYIEYGLAELGAVQVWKNSLSNQSKAVADYRSALSLGATVPLPELFQAAGVKFAFDSPTLREACDLMIRTINQLETL